jgi:hypothetical protein
MRRESGMDMPTSGKEVQGTSDAPSGGQEKSTPSATRGPSIIVGTRTALPKTDRPIPPLKLSKN